VANALAANGRLWLLQTLRLRCAGRRRRRRGAKALAASGRQLFVVSDRQLATNARQRVGGLMCWTLWKNWIAPSAGHVYLRAASGQPCATNVR
jgi:hypothetical protein